MSAAGRGRKMERFASAVMVLDSEQIGDQRKRVQNSALLRWVAVVGFGARSRG